LALAYFCDVNLKVGTFALYLHLDSQREKFTALVQHCYEYTGLESQKTNVGHSDVKWRELTTSNGKTKKKTVSVIKFQT
jgi:hypothetical protein